MISLDVLFAAVIHSLLDAYVMPLIDTLHVTELHDQTRKNSLHRKTKQDLVILVTSLPPFGIPSTVRSVQKIYVSLVHPVINLASYIVTTIWRKIYTSVVIM